MMQGQNNNDDDIMSYMEICDFDLASSSNSLEMDLNMPDFALFHDPPQNDFTLENLNQNQIQNQIQNPFASFEAMNPNPNPNPNPNHNFTPPFRPFFRAENLQTGQNLTRLSLNQNLHIPPPMNNNNPSLNNNNNIASSSRGETDISRPSRKRPDAMPPQQNRGTGIAINNPSSSSRYSGISNSGASESMQGNVGIGGGFVRNTRMRIDPTHNVPFAFNPNLPPYNIPLPNPNPNPLNPNPMLGITDLHNPNPSSVPRIGTNTQSIQAVPITRQQSGPVPVMVPAPRLTTDDQIRRVLINSFNASLSNSNQARNQSQSQTQGVPASVPVTIPTGTVQARSNNNNNNFYNNNNNSGFPGFNIGSLNGSERPQFRRFVSTHRPRSGTAGVPVMLPAMQNLSRRREQTQVVLDNYRQSMLENRRRVARQMLGILRPGESISVEDIILFEQTISFGDSVPDRHRDMRLDVDNMSYEELLALEERIGNVSTGLSEEAIMKRLKQKLYINNLSVSSEGTEPCCICQEEYEEGDKVGRLECGHDFHTACIKQWLVQKNLCPICKKPGLNA